MSRKGLSNLLPFAILLSSFNLIFPLAANAASIGTAPCVQTIDVTAGVSVYQDGNSCFIAFKSVGTYSWTPPTGVSKIDVLVVAGGGGGGARHAGGGGAGGLINSTDTTINTSALSITVGSGGAGGPAVGYAGTEGLNGNNSQVSGGGISTMTAIGGGAGAYGAVSGSGGSGGGGGCCGAGQGTATSGQGNVGTRGVGVSAGYAGGGGGGAGSAGGVTSLSTGGAGGAGLVIPWVTTIARSNLSVGDLVNSQVYFAGGGGGGTDRAGIPAGLGGSGGGGAGTVPSSAGINGSANTGGGGGGSGINGNGASKGGDGGSGVVVIRYSIPSFTNSATFSIAENTATSVNAASITVSESSTISIRATLDYAFFTIVATDTLNAKIRFMNSPDYEAFADAGANNEFDLTIRATNSSGNFQEFSIKITLTNVLEAATSGLPTISGAAYKGLPVTITISTSVPGKLRFFVGSKRIPNCLSRSTIGSYPNFSATCSWKPATSGLQPIRAMLTPTDGAISPITSAASSFLVTRRTNTR